METNKAVKNASAIGSLAGLTGGLIYAFRGKKKFWGYVGYGLLFSLIGSGVASLGAYAVLKFKKPTAVPETTNTEENPE